MCYGLVFLQVVDQFFKVLKIAWEKKKMAFLIYLPSKKCPITSAARVYWEYVCHLKTENLFFFFYRQKQQQQEKKIVQLAAFD